MAKLSVSMCPASASRAKLPLKTPPTASTTMNPVVSAKVRASRWRAVNAPEASG